MRRIRSFLLTFVMTLPFLFLASSCNGHTEDYNKIDSVKKEVDYTFTAISFDGVTIDGHTYFLEEEGEKLLERKTRLYPYDETIDENHIYYLYEYGSHGEIGGPTNQITLDVALLQMSVHDGSVTLLYDFKEVYPMRKYQYTKQSIYSYIDNDTLSFLVNGQLQLFDVNQKEIVYSVDVYDKEEYRNSQGGKSFAPVDDSYDYADIQGNEITYYKYDGDKYEIIPFSTEYVSDYRYHVGRIGQYAYTYDYDNGTKYIDCFNLETKTQEDISILENLLAENSDGEDSDFSTVTIDGKHYHWRNIGEYESSLYDENGELVALFNEELFQTSQAYTQLFDSFGNTAKYKVVSLNVADDKLFLSLRAHYRWMGYTPIFIYEYDFVNNALFYVGYLPHSVSSIARIEIRR